jgi:lysine 6-dehydrogenase
VTIVDQSQEQLNATVALLRDKPGFHKLAHTPLDLAQINAAVDLMADFDAAVAALPRPVNILAMKAALQAGLPLVDLAQTYPETQQKLEKAQGQSGGFIILGCGVEPGLTEIVARHLAEKMDRVDELHIKCGGIPQNPAPPLNYKIVFGGKQMPLREADSEIVVNGQIQYVPRYSGVEILSFPTVGQCEAWHEGFKPWILDVPALKDIKAGTQKTIRWPGYAAKVSVLRELGLLSLEPVQVGDVSVKPKQLVDALLYPHVKLEKGERDITCFRVELLGAKDGQSCHYKADMVDRYDVDTGFTSMARTTAFTGAIVARMIAAGKIEPPGRRIVTPETVLVGPAFNHLMRELQKMNIRIEISEEPYSAARTQD